MLFFHDSPLQQERHITVLELSAVIGAGSLIAGFLGSLTGLGGGVVIVPLLTLALGVDIRYAIGASLISVIATSSGAAAAYSEKGFANIRIGMFLELAAAGGALAGAFAASMLSPEWIAAAFGLVLLHSAYMTIRTDSFVNDTDPPDRLASYLRLNGCYPARQGPREYRVRSVPGGFAVMLVAGLLSGLLGIGSGALKVVGMDRLMRIPFKVSTATSNFMIGITAAAGAGIYLGRGYIDPGLAMPVMLGVLGGSLLGARFLTKTKTKPLRMVFAITIAVLGFEMLCNAFSGRW